MVLNAIDFLFCSLIANMATILINFQQKFALVRSFQHFAIKFLNQKRFLTRLKTASKSSSGWRGKCDVFLLEFYLAINPSSLASENDVTELSELQSCKNNLKPLASISLGSASQKTLLINANEEVSVMWAQARLLIFYTTVSLSHKKALFSKISDFVIACYLRFGLSPIINTD